MSGSSSNDVLRQVHRLFNVGVVGTLSDAQLLDRFVSRRDETAEAAFEELLHRHGPMVLRVCRSVLNDEHEVEDAFQAVFLVLVNRVAAIRRRGAVASWLFGVAQRVATRARRSAGRRHRRNRRVAAQTSEAYVPSPHDLEWEILHEEIDSLPERLRGPIVLCYLEGRDYQAGAQELGLSEATLRGRLARARQRLRRRLIQRGVTSPAALLASGDSTKSLAAVPGPLVHSTIRIALGFASANATAVLAPGVLNSMLLNRLMVAAALVIFTAGSGFLVWRPFAAAGDERVPVRARPIPASDQRSDDPPRPQAKAPAGARLTGTVTLDGTGLPIAGAMLQISVGFVMGAGSQSEKIVETGADGRFTVDLPEGNTRVWLSDPPPGYLILSMREAMEDLDVRADQPAIHREYRVRKGTIWNFQFTRGSNQRPFPGLVTVIPTLANRALPSRAQADDHGQARLTLLSEGGKVTLAVRESDARLVTEIQTGFLELSLEWEPDFRPDGLQAISPLEGKDRGFRMIDSDAKSAVLKASEPISAVNDNGKLVIRVSVPYRDAKDFAALTGQIIDEDGQPIARARVGFVPPGIGEMPSELSHGATTDPGGRYRLRDIPRRAIDGKPLGLRLTVTKEGYAGVQSPRLNLAQGDTERPEVVDPIRLVRGATLSGIVFDHRGQPASGASVQSIQPFLQAGSSGTPQTSKTDKNGRFRMPGLHRGVAVLYVVHGKVRKSNFVLADGSAEDVRIKLPERMEEPGIPIGGPLAPPPEPLAVGRPAPEWQVGPWSDGRARKLADLRGKVVVLYFWGIAFSPSIGYLPAMGKLAAKFQPRGVEFLAIHSSDPDEEFAREQARKVLAFKHAPLAMAVDQSSGIPKRSRGLTAQQYGMRAQAIPLVVVIDREGKIACRSDTASGSRNQTAIFTTQMVQNPKSMTEQTANEQAEQALAVEIEKALQQKD